jgi:hypothetical protein
MESVYDIYTIRKFRTKPHFIMKFSCVMFVFIHYVYMQNVAQIVVRKIKFRSKYLTKSTSLTNCLLKKIKWLVNFFIREKRGLSSKKKVGWDHVAWSWYNIDEWLWHHNLWIVFVNRLLVDKLCIDNRAFYRWYLTQTSNRKVDIGIRFFSRQMLIFVKF